MIAADSSAARSIIKMKGDEDKIRQIGSTLIFTYNGEPGRLFIPLPFLHCVLLLTHKVTRGYHSIRRIRGSQSQARYHTVCL